MSDKVKKIVDMLSSYRPNKRKIQQLRFEVEHPARMSEADIITSMAIGSSLPDAIRTAEISDRTMLVASRYRDVAQQMNLDSQKQITRELHALERDVERLEHYVSLLDERQAQVIRLRDFDGKPWNEIEEVLDKPQRTLSDLRQAAITELAVMYGYIEDLKQK